MYIPTFDNLSAPLLSFLNKRVSCNERISNDHHNNVHTTGRSFFMFRSQTILASFEGFWHNAYIYIIEFLKTMSGIVFCSLYFDESMFVRNECIIHDLLITIKYIKPYLFHASMQSVYIHMVAHIPYKNQNYVFVPERKVNLA